MYLDDNIKYVSAISMNIGFVKLQSWSIFYKNTVL